MLVILSPTFGPNFRRCVRDAKGNVTQTLEFEQGEPVDVDDGVLEVIRNDIAKGALLLCTKSPSGVLRADREATTRFVQSTKPVAPKPKKTAKPAKPKPPGKSKGRKGALEEILETANEPQQPDGETDEQSVS